MGLRGVGGGLIEDTLLGIALYVSVATLQWAVESFSHAAKVWGLLTQIKVATVQFDVEEGWMLAERWPWLSTEVSSYVQGANVSRSAPERRNVRSVTTEERLDSLGRDLLSICQKGAAEY